MTATEDTLPQRLQIDALGDGAYEIAADETYARDVVHGVHLMAWAMSASAHEGLGDHVVKTAHGVFSRPVARSAPIELAVERFSSGRAFGADTITVTQGGKNAARVQLLFSVDEPDLIRHADEMPSVPGPDGCDPFPAGGIGGPGTEVRVVGEVDYLAEDHPVLPPRLLTWVRSTVPVPGSVAQQAMLCSETGTSLIGTAMLPHAGVGQMQAHRTISTGVVSHTITFHDPFDLGDWVLLDEESIHAGAGRTHGRGRVFTPDGRLVASYVQDAMIRHFTDGKDHSAQARTIM